jgi:threonine dehydrogenase-like Zn-dependent dehydrogenase
VNSLFDDRSAGPHDVRVRMKAVGICGSDVHYLRVLALLAVYEFNLTNRG